MTWGFVDITLLAMQEIQAIDSEHSSTTTAVTNHCLDQVLGRRNYRQQLGITKDENDEESQELSA